MSLTSFLRIKEVKEAFASEFEKPKLKLDWKIKVPPGTTNYSLVGTAFDYLMRFYLERLNPFAVTEPWVCERAVEVLNLGLKDLSELKELEEIQWWGVMSGIKSQLGQTKLDYPKLVDMAETIVKEAKMRHSQYVKSGHMTNEVIKTVILMSQLDLIFRGGYLYRNIGKVDRRDILDLKSMLSIIPKNIFTAKSICLLNPTFGDAGKLIGGADADIVIDNRIIDIKTVKKCEIRRDNFNQIIGYYILGRIGGIGENHRVDASDIEEIGVYFSRFGKCCLFDVDTIINQDTISAFMDWFKNRAQAEFKILMIK